jgi:hypothetical protein
MIGQLAYLAALAALPGARSAPRTVLVAPPAPPAAPYFRASRPATIRVATNGEAIIVDGALGWGSAARFAAVVARAPRARTIYLSSPGGLLVEAERIAAIVRRNALATYVEFGCLSACTMILLSGTDRAAAPSARIGFHRPIWTAARPDGGPGQMEAARSFYERAGIPPAFTDRVFATPNDDMWYPSYEELLAARVLTRRTLGGETSAVFTMIDSREEFQRLLSATPYWRPLEARYPDIARRILDAAWDARARGGTDTAIGNAMRAMMVLEMPRIMAGANAEVLDRYILLMGRQAEAARALGFEACDRLVRGELNIGLVLPAALVEEEMALTTAALTAPVNPEALDGAEAVRILEGLISSLPEAQIDAINSMTDTNVRSNPADRCEAVINLFGRIAALPPPARRLVTRNMLMSPQ